MVDLEILLQRPTVTRPRWMPETAWVEHGPFAFWLIERLRPRTVVELGVHRGYSLCAFAEAMERRGVAGRVIGVDTWVGDEHAGFYGEEVLRDLSAHVRPLYGDRVELKRMYFSEALAEIADGSIDLLHIDGRHHYEDVVADFTSWLPKLSPRAVVLFHDTQVRERDFGVWRLWGEIAATRPSFEFLHGHGLGVLAQGPEAPVAALAGLLDGDLDAAAVARVRGHWAGLGAAVGAIAAREAKRARRRAKLRRLPGKAMRRISAFVAGLFGVGGWTAPVAEPRRPAAWRQAELS